MATNAVDLYFGEQTDIDLFARRIKTMMRGGEKLSDNDARSLAQVAAVTHLNPFIGEVWWIPGSGAMIGIAGARRVDQEDTKARGGYSWPVVTVCTPEEAGATEFEVKDVVAAFKTEINDSTATAEYQKMFSATLEALRGAGVADPFSAAKEVCGSRPVWTGYGLAKKSDQSRMSKVQLARKRSEADALKKKTIIPFGAQVAETDVSPEYTDTQATDIGNGKTEKHSIDENRAALGFDATKAPEWQDTPEEWEEKPARVVEPVSKAMPREASLGSITPEEAIQEDTPEIRAELRKEFSQRYNAAAKKVDSKKLPTLPGKATAKEISKAIVAIDEVQAAS